MNKTFGCYQCLILLLLTISGINAFSQSTSKDVMNEFMDQYFGMFIHFEILATI